MAALERHDDRSRTRHRARDAVPAIGASRMRPDASAYVLDVANTFHPQLAPPRPAVRRGRIDDLDRRAS
jgi:hypothetical protein